MASDPGGGSHHHQPPLSTPLHCSPYLGLLGKEGHVRNIAIYGLMLYTAPCVMLLMRANPLRRQVGGGWALEIETFCRPVKWHHAVGRVPFGAQNSHT